MLSPKYVCLGVALTSKIHRKRIVIVQQPSIADGVYNNTTIEFKLVLGYILPFRYAEGGASVTVSHSSCEDYPYAANPSAICLLIMTCS